MKLLLRMPRWTLQLPLQREFNFYDCHISISRFCFEVSKIHRLDHTTGLDNSALMALRGWEALGRRFTVYHLVRLGYRCVRLIIWMDGWMELMIMEWPDGMGWDGVDDNDSPYFVHGSGLWWGMRAHTLFVYACRSEYFI